MLLFYIAKRMNKVYFSRKETLPGYVSRSETNLLMVKLAIRLARSEKLICAG